MKPQFPKILGTESAVTLLNNAATTPPFEETLNEVNDFMQTYGALHRGAGPHANITYQKVQDALFFLREFFHVRDDQEFLFTSNTSSAINLFARLLNFKKEDVVITSSIEHTSNNLPWKYNSQAQIIEVESFLDGSLDMEDLKKKIHEHKKHLKLVSLTGASNQTGYIPPIEEISEMVHSVGALFFIDAAQLAPHREIDIKQGGIDALAFSAHKMYAPFGLGVLVLPKKLLEGSPVDPGGGSVDMVSDTSIVWVPSDDRHQIGTWNVVGIIALQKSCRILHECGWKNIVKHEKELIQYFLDKTSEVPDFTLYVPKKKYLIENRIGTFPFTLKKYHHALLAAILEHEYGIETRAGTICNHRLVRKWFDISDEKQKEIEREIQKGNRLATYGIVRVSLGIHNTQEDFDRLIHALKEISLFGPKFFYRPIQKEEIFQPA